MKKLLLAIALLCFACEPRTTEQNLKLIHYYRDARTNLCFANGWGGGYQGGPWATNVPCSPEVMSLVEHNLYVDTLY